MEGERVADYFVVGGLPVEGNPQLVDEDYCEGLNANQQNIEPVTDITVIFHSLGECVPKGFECVETTPTGFPANLNSGSLRSPEVYLCYRRGRDKPPLVDIGVMYDGKERLLPDAEVVLSTPEGRPANVNNTSARTLLTFRRAPENMPCNELVVTDICVIFQNKGEKPPHAFCLIQKNLNKGMMGSDVFLCYKKSMNRPPLLSFKPEVILRYPPIDRRNFPFPPLTATFCLPMCCTIECWPKNSLQPRPVFSTFVLTVADATEKIYGAAITFYELYGSDDKLTDEQREALEFVTAADKAAKDLHVNKCICILSHHPFFDAFKTFLYYLNWMMRNGPHDVPIERYISHLLEEVPYPSLQRPHILMQLSPTQNILLSHPHESPLPKSGASFRAMLNNLGTENCLMVILLVLTEQKLLIHSLRPDVLTAVAEAISVLIFPFRWQCPYVPLTPLGLCGVIQAPVPFLVGVDSRFFDLYEPPTDLTCIDLDTNTITVSEDKKYLLNVKLLPKKPTRILKNALENIKLISDRMAMMTRGSAKGRSDTTEAMDIDFQLKRRERSIEMEIQESFLRFMTTILKGYRQFLLPITKAPTIGATDASSLFDFQGFLRSRDKTYQKFYQLMLKTQMFFRFIEERSFVSENDSSLEFFDECVDKVEADETDAVKLLEIHEGTQSDRTVFVMPPEPTGLPANSTYLYNHRFILKEGLFGGPKLKPQAVGRVMQLSEFASPGSPVAKRTKQEIKSAQKVAKKFVESPHLWAKYLLSTCYSIWFIHLPSYMSIASSKHMALCLAYEMLARMASCKLHPVDEVCYRVVMQLCGLYSQPVIAVKVLLHMKRCGIIPNAITYGYYNRAVLEAEWPSNVSNSSQLMWNKLRNVIIGVAHFRAGTKHRNGIDVIDESDRISTGSGISIDSQARNLLPPSASTGAVSGKSQSDSEVANMASAIPTRISSSSDIGYGSMQDQNKAAAEEELAGGDFSDPNDRQAKLAKFWKGMGRSLDQWVKSGVSSLATLAAESPYYSQSGYYFGGYAGDYDGGNMKYEDEEDDDVDDQLPNKTEIRGKSRKRLDFGSDEKEGGEKSENQTIRLLRSVSFGNDAQIMSKLKLIKDEVIASDKKSNNSAVGQENLPGPSKSSDTTQFSRRSASVESTSSASLESKINQYYEPTANKSSRDTSAEKSISQSREVTPDESHEAYQDTIKAEVLNPPRSPSIQIRSVAALSREVTPASPARTPVVQDDPLGALTEPSDNDNKSKVPHSNSNSLETPNKDSPKRTCSEGHLGGLVEKVIMGPPETPKGFHRSSTLPSYGTTMGERVGSSASMNSAPSDEKIAGSSGGQSGLSMFSSNLKNPFGRYSPGRLSLRKAGTSLIESTIGGKKAEAWMEGFNQLKSAATVSVKTKLEELKEVVGNNATPGRNGPFGRYDDTRELDEVDDLEPDPGTDQWASVSESYLDQVLTTESGSTHRASFASEHSIRGLHESPITSSRNSLGDNFKNLCGVPSTSRANRRKRPISQEINMNTLSICHSCHSLLFDEEIMSGWTSEDSNLNTRCPHCKKWEVPFLEVTVIDYRHNPMPHFQNFQMNSAPSLESVNMSRRASIIYSQVPSTNVANTPLNPKTQQADNIKASAKENGSGDTSNDGSAPPKELDPLGVLEEIHRSRKTSPETEIASSTSEHCSTTPAEPLDLNTPVPHPAESASANIPLVDVSSNSVPPDYQSLELEGAIVDPIVVPYLSPLVLRKELENVLDHEGDTCLINYQFVDEHPIIYWNLVWFFHRSNLPSHIKGLTLQAKSLVPNKLVKKPEKDSEKEKSSEDMEPFSIHPSWEGVDHRTVLVNCFWDNPKYHKDFTTPLYLEWIRIKDEERSEKKRELTEDEKKLDSNLLKLMNNVRRATHGNTLQQTCPSLLFHYHKQASPRHYPTYRDILFLCLIAGRDSIEAYGYGLDKEYRDVYSKLRSNDDYESMDVGDTPPSDTALFCRRFFRELQLLQPQ